MPVRIRPATTADSAALSHICLVTADAGQSAEHLYSIPELPGLIYAVPYVHLPTGCGFVLEEEQTGQVVGYVLSTLDTTTFAAEGAKTWLPPLQAKYPYVKDEKDQLDSPFANATAHDKRAFRLLHNPDKAPDGVLAFSPAHLHIDILPEYQRKGWGRKLINVLVQYLQSSGLKAVWLGMDPRNTDARKFYLRIGFAPIEGQPDMFVGLAFKNWKYQEE